ncbi:MAG: hypothetical protein EYC70_11465 [Planctomycetota bacterium]|nr:MAG: hypothetical protein EYC70_11465 [Planctomycetota bacterium]
MSALEFEPGLAEEAVFLWVSRRLESEATVAAWQRERESLYHSAPGPARERAFREHAAGWFDRLRLGQPIHSALRACPRVAQGIPALSVRGVVRARDEGSEVLGTAGADQPERMVLGLRPQRFLDPPALEELALREFLHADDMLDPEFGFDPVFDPGFPSGYGNRERVRDRLRVLWEARVHGRMARGVNPRAAPPAPDADFRVAFGRDADSSAVDALFCGAWSGALATYGALLERAAHPGTRSAAG